MKKWVEEFKQDKDKTECDPLQGRPKISTTDEQVNTFHRMVLNNIHLSWR